MTKFQKIFIFIQKSFFELQLYKNPILLRRFKRLKRTIDDGKKPGLGREVKYFVEKIRAERQRLKQGDPIIYHPVKHNGLSNGELPLAHTIVTGALWSVNISRKPDVPHQVIHVNVSGASGGAKSNFAALFIRSMFRSGLGGD